MNWNCRVRQLLDLDDEIDTDGQLRKHTRNDQLYKLDRRRWLVKAIERMCDAEDEGYGWLDADGD